MKLLVVEDIGFSRIFLKKLFEQNGHEVLQASTGSEAFDYLKSNFDVEAVVCDLMMPGMNGIELLKKVQLLDCYRHLRRRLLPPFILITACQDRQLLEEAKTAGFWKILLKPLNADEMNGELQLIHQGKHLLSCPPLNMYVIDGSESILDPLEKAIEGTDHKYQCFSSGQEALGLLQEKKEHVSIILYDNSVSDLAPLDFIAKYHELFPGKRHNRSHFLLFSNDLSSEFLEKAAMTDFGDVIPKPIEQYVFSKRLGQVYQEYCNHYRPEGDD